MPRRKKNIEPPPHQKWRFKLDEWPSTMESSKPGTYKGYRVYERGDLDGWTVPQLDKESVFDTKGDAKRFIDAMAKRENPKYYAPYRGYRVSGGRIVRNGFNVTGRWYKTKAAAKRALDKMKTKKANPRTLIPAQIIIKNGKARVFVTQAAMRKMNPSGTLHEYKVIFVGPTHNQTHTVYATTAGNASKIARKDKKHLFDRPRDWKVLSIKRMN